MLITVLIRCVFAACWLRNIPISRFRWSSQERLTGLCRLPAVSTVRPTWVWKCVDTLRSLFGVHISTWPGANVPMWRTVSTSRHSSQTTTKFCFINISGRSTYSSVHWRRHSVSCCSHSSMEQSFIARHCCPSLSIFCCGLKSHLFSLSYPAFWLFSHLYSARTVSRHSGHFNRYYV